MHHHYSAAHSSSSSEEEKEQLSQEEVQVAGRTSAGRFGVEGGEEEE